MRLVAVIIVYKAFEFQCLKTHCINLPRETVKGTGGRRGRGGGDEGEEEERKGSRR